MNAKRPGAKRALPQRGPRMAKNVAVRATKSMAKLAYPAKKGS